MIHWLLGGQNLLLRVSGAAVVSFVIVLLLGPRMIRFLVKRKLGDRPEFDHADLNRLAEYKSNTPTMGGGLIVIAIFAATVLFADLANGYMRMAMVALIWLGGLGAVDDWLKLRYAAGTGSRDGLKMWEKLVFQIGIAVLLAVFTRSYGRYVEPAQKFYFPFVAEGVHLPVLAYVLIMVVTLVGSTNAVNLTDGMDGLAAGCTAIVAGVFLLVAWVVGVTEWAALFHLPLIGREAAEMTVICAAMIGALLGFLWYNAPPAQVFMGDTGSLPLGGIIAYIALVTRQELLLLIAGGVFVMEAMSVVLQIGYFKMTKGGGVEGKRLFRCAPVHHHFHLGGWAETKVVVRFWLLGLLCAALALATLKLR
ncbi:MAG: phospho-N-acetylmuramoyl-pentapeptide-transferase [Planctomycetota bacterium]